MGPWLLGAIGLAELGAAWDYLRKRRIGMLIAMVGYAIGNVGLIIDYYESKS